MTITREDLVNWIVKGEPIEPRFPYGWKTKIREALPKTEFSSAEVDEYKEAKKKLEEIEKIISDIQEGKINVYEDATMAEYYGGVKIPKSETADDILRRISEGATALTLDEIKKLVEESERAESVVESLRLVEVPEASRIVKEVERDISPIIEEALKAYDEEKKIAARLKDAVNKCETELNQCIITCKSGDVKPWMERTIKCENELETIKAGGVELLSPERTVRNCVDRLKRIRRFDRNGVEICGMLGKEEVKEYEEKMMEKIDDIITMYERELSRA